MDLSPPRIESVARDSDAYIEICESIDTSLASLLPPADSDEDRVGEAMRTSLLSGGKRIRPMLLVLAGRGLGSDSPALLDLGCAVEMVHSASLVLDDLPCMDNAQLRRGQPAIHRQFGEDVAMLAAVALLTDAFRLVATTPGVAAEARIELIARLADASGMQGLVKGQYRDLHDTTRLRSSQAVLATNALKTGALFEAAMGMAATVAGADAFAKASLKCFAQALGQAFQLHDDLNDESTCHGKDAGQDRGRATLIALLGTQAVRCRLEMHLEEAERHLALVFGPGQPIRRYAQGLFTQLARST